MGANSSKASSEGDVVLLGCVAYAENIGTIWEGMRQYFLSVGVPFDFVMFTSYDRQLEALMKGHIDVAWNGPLAHTRLKRRTGGKAVSLGMRDCDRDFTTHLVVRKDAGITGLTDLHGKRVATGCYDSPQAYILPLHAVATSPGGADILKTMHVVRFDRDVGKHGDTAAGEVEVLKALSAGEVDAGFVSDIIWQRAVAKGEVNGKKQAALQVVAEAVPKFDHCQFDCLPALAAAKRDAFSKALHAMTMSDPEHAEVMKLEGISKRWETPREEGYEAMHAALANETPEPFPPPLDTEASHRFASLEVSGQMGVHATKFERACV